MEVGSLKKDAAQGFIWRLLQNFSAQSISFIIQLILARILLPSDFGILAITTIFISISNILVQVGFSSSIVQKKNLDETDKSTMFFISCILGFVLYFLIFVSAPFIAKFYNQEILILILRIQSLSLIAISFSSVSIALIMRSLNFKKSFIAGIISYAFQGVIGVYMALNGYGVWSLVISSLTYNFVYSIVSVVVCKWSPKLLFSFKSAIEMLSFSSKILGTSMLNTIYNSSQSLIIGKVFSPTILGYYNRGVQLPKTIVTGIDGAMTTVLFSSLSRIQDDKKELVKFLRKSMKISLAIVVPFMCGLAAVADPLIRVLFTDKWESSIPFVMIYSCITLTWPLSAKSHALNSIGKSGVNFSLNIIMKIFSVILMLISLRFGIYVFAITGLITAIANEIGIGVIVTKYFNYSIREQIRDVLPVYTIGFIMFIIVYLLSHFIIFNLYLDLLILIIIGVFVYTMLSYIFKLEGFMFLYGNGLILIRKKFDKKYK